MIQPHLIEAVFQREATLNFMRLDHGSQHVTHRERLSSPQSRRCGTPVGHRKYAAEIIRWMPPFGSKPGIVEIEPANHCTDIECRLYRIKLELGTGNSRPIRHSRARNERSKQSGAGRVSKRLHRAT